MKNFNNIDELVVDDLKKELKAHSKLTIETTSWKNTAIAWIGIRNRSNQQSN